jgi:hypothetical protein
MLNILLFLEMLLARSVWHILYIALDVINLQVSPISWCHGSEKWVQRTKGVLVGVAAMFCSIW